MLLETQRRASAMHSKANEWRTVINIRKRPPIGSVGLECRPVNLRSPAKPLRWSVHDADGASVHGRPDFDRPLAAAAAAAAAAANNSRGRRRCTGSNINGTGFCVRPRS